MNPADCYKKLGLNYGAPAEEVKASYRKLAFKYHPDLSDTTDAAQRFREINEAYVFLTQYLEEKSTKWKAQDVGERRGTRQRPRREKPKTSASDGAQAYKRQQKQSKKGSRRPGFKDSARSRSQGFYFKEEEVLNDLLKDPFARQVFEDIYSQVKRDKPKKAGAMEMKRKSLKFNWGKKSVNLDVTKGLVGGVKSWARGQLDDEQTVHFPASSLLPGNKIRITVQQAFTDEPKTIEVSLPPDFVIGRPIRLKKLGKKLGPFTGDLLLRVLPRQ